MYSLIVQSLVRLLVACCTMLVSDLLWLGVVMRNSYGDMAAAVQQRPVRIRPVPALLAPLLVSTGLWSITLLDGRSWSAEYQKNAVMFGLSVFGVYNLSNFAVFENWQVSTAFIDTIYGTLLCSAVYALLSQISWA